MEEKIKKFVLSRPDVEAAYGYGSGVFKQSGYTNADKPQIDLILVVNNLRDWHIANMKLNKTDYSFIGKDFFTNAKIEKLKGLTGITYLSNIEEDGNVFKYGTIELNDLYKHLYEWDSFYLPGRFQKTIYPIIENNTLTNLVDKNREYALLLSSYLQKYDVVTKKEILTTLCGLSYMGDTRMKLAENPRKVLNIVEGSYDKFTKMYNFDVDYIKCIDDDICVIDKELLRRELKRLPYELCQYIMPVIDEKDEVIKEKIIEYFTILNKEESLNQTIKGLYTNGFVRSVDYAYKKVKKRFKK